MCKCRNKGSTYSVDTLYGFKTSLKMRGDYCKLGIITSRLGVPLRPSVTARHLEDLLKRQKDRLGSWFLSIF